MSASLAPAIDYHLRYYEEGEDGTLMQMYDSPEAVRQDTATLHVASVELAAELLVFAAIRSIGAGTRAPIGCARSCTRWESRKEYDLETSAGGHTWEYYNHMAPTAMQYIADRLEREALADRLRWFVRGGRSVTSAPSR